MHHEFINKIVSLSRVHHVHENTHKEKFDLRYIHPFSAGIRGRSSGEVALN